MPASLNLHGPTCLAHVVWNGSTTCAHHVGVQADGVHIRPYHGHSVRHFALNEFVDLVVENGRPSQGATLLASYELDATGSDLGSSIGFTATEIVVRKPGSSARRAVGFEKIREICMAHPTAASDQEVCS